MPFWAALDWFFTSTRSPATTATPSIVVAVPLNGMLPLARGPSVAVVAALTSSYVRAADMGANWRPVWPRTGAEGLRSVQPPVWVPPLTKTAKPGDSSTAVSASDDRVSEPVPPAPAASNT